MKLNMTMTVGLDTADAVDLQTLVSFMAGLGVDIQVEAGSAPARPAAPEPQPEPEPTPAAETPAAEEAEDVQTPASTEEPKPAESGDEGDSYEAMLKAEGLKPTKTGTDGSGSRVAIDDEADLNGESVSIAALARGKAVVVTEEGKTFIVATADLNAPANGGEPDTQAQTEPTQEAQTEQTPAAEAQTAQTQEAEAQTEQDPGTDPVEAARAHARALGTKVKTRISVDAVVACIKAADPKAQLLSDLDLEGLKRAAVNFQSALDKAG